MLTCGFFHSSDRSGNERRASGQIFNGRNAQRFYKRIDRSCRNDTDFRHLHQRSLVLVAYTTSEEDTWRPLLLGELTQPWQLEPLPSDNQDRVGNVFVHDSKRLDEVINTFLGKYSAKIRDDPGSARNT